MPKPTAPLLVALLLSACRPPAAPPELAKATVVTEACATFGQRYRVEYERVSGACGDLPPTVVTYGERAPGCVARSIATTWDGCALSAVEVCNGAELNRLTSTVRFAPSGVSGGGTMGVERWSEGGSLLCTGSYMLTWVRL